MWRNIESFKENGFEWRRMNKLKKNMKIIVCKYPIKREYVFAFFMIFVLLFKRNRMLYIYIIFITLLLGLIFDFNINLIFVA